MTKRLLILVVGILCMSLATGCGGGGGGSSIAKVYEGTWTGMAVHQTEGCSDLQTLFDITYEKADGFGNEVFSLTWLSNGEMLAIAPFYGYYGGSIHVEFEDYPNAVDLIAAVSGDSMTGSFELWSYFDDEMHYGVWTIHLLRQK